jgi:Lar family restriction alleviation protein
VKNYKLTEQIKNADRPEELKPCPFCGGEAELVEHEPNSMTYYVRCLRCDCATRLISNRGDSGAKELCSEAWNTRAYESELASMRDLLDRAKGFVKIARMVNGEITREGQRQWLKDYKEVCGE